MYYSRSEGTPVEKGLTLSLDQWPKTYDEIGTINNVPYASVVGNLM